MENFKSDQAYTLNNTQVTYVEQTLEVVGVYTDLFAYRHTSTSKTVYKKQRFETLESNINEGFINKVNIQAFEQALEWKPIQNIYLCTDEQIERFRTKGFLNGLEFKRETDVFSGKTFDLVKNKLITLKNIVRIDTDMREIYNYKNDHLPVGIYFDYISSHMDNAHYDLEKTVQYLQTLDNITLYKAKNFSDQLVVAIPGDQIIDDIPFYNSSDVCNKCIEFVFAPTKEEYELILKLSEEKSKYTCYAKIIFDQDILGLRKSKAALFDDYYQSKKTADCAKEYETY